VKQIKEASLDVLAAHIGNAKAQIVFNHWHNQTPPEKT